MFTSAALMSYLPMAIAFLAGAMVQTKYPLIEKIKGFFNKPDPNTELRDAMVKLAEAQAKVTK